MALICLMDANCKHGGLFGSCSELEPVPILYRGVGLLRSRGGVFTFLSQTGWIDVNLVLEDDPIRQILPKLS